MKGIRYYVNSECDSIVEIKTCNSYLHSSKSHLHNEISIGLIESGSCNLELYGNSYFICEKSFLIIPAGIVHKCSPLNLEKWSFKMLYINREWIKKNFEVEIGESGFMHKELSLSDYESIKNLFSKLGKERSIIEEEYLLFEIVSKVINSEKKSYTIIENIENYTVKIEKSKKYIDEFYLKNISLKELADISGVTRYYLIRKFEEMYGISPHKYMNLKKAAYAKNLLKNNRSIAEAAIEAGFYDQSHFNKFFKEYTGVTPKSYLKDIKK